MQNIYQKTGFNEYTYFANKFDESDHRKHRIARPVVVALFQRHKRGKEKNSKMLKLSQA